MTVKEETKEMENEFKSKTNGKNMSHMAKSPKSKSAAALKLKKKIERLETEKNELKDQLLRKVAEFENYKKRTENEYSQLIKNANADLVADLLPVLDDLERSLASLNDKKRAENFEDFREGVELIYKNLTKVLEGKGVKAIEAIGQKFDPEKHHALMQIESKDQPSDTVVDEHLKGYIMNDRVLRHSQVLVSK